MIHSTHSEHNVAESIYFIYSNLLLCRCNIFPIKGNSVSCTIKYTSHKDYLGVVMVSNSELWA